ncbi:hypothetical protein GSI_10089 [Ganoderma sinense ZZ0214-1]|uniref:Uncharacterized protein n=1 Tax=Ganoderma sinense ZZ0214-1 TaxID=1077348 RepID=A0A2G8RZK0_9APHY|nr:hypothetical protein GSI_10089 [Ganoderma sinense ZZ0214-1]
MEYMSTSFKDHLGSDSTQRDQQTRTKRHQTYRACKPARAPARRYTTATASEIDWLGGSVKGVPRPLAPNPKPLCMIPFDVLMSDARTGKFQRAHEPVFVYLAVAIPTAEIRIRLIIEGTPQTEMKARRFQNGKPITKGDLAMSIADEVDKVFVSAPDRVSTPGTGP